MYFFRPNFSLGFDEASSLPSSTSFETRSSDMWGLVIDYLFLRALFNSFSILLRSLYHLFFLKPYIITSFFRSYHDFPPTKAQSASMDLMFQFGRILNTAADSRWFRTSKVSWFLSSRAKPECTKSLSRLWNWEFFLSDPLYCSWRIQTIYGPSRNR